MRVIFGQKLKKCSLHKINAYEDSCSPSPLAIRWLVLLSKIVFTLSNFWNFNVCFHQLLKQYQECLYLFQCIYHGGSNYGHKIPQFWHRLQHLLHFWHVFVQYECTCDKSIIIISTTNLNTMTILRSPISHRLGKNLLDQFGEKLHVTY